MAKGKKQFIEFRITKTRKMIELEEKYGKPIDEIIYEMYVENDMSQEKIAGTFGISQGSLSSWMMRLGIPSTANAKSIIEKFRQKRG